jgi:hypothetical protein
MGRAHEMAPSRQTVGGPAVALHIAERVPIASLSDSASGRICCCAATGGCGTRFGPRGRFLYAVPAGRSTQSAYKKHHTGGGRSEAHTTSSPTGYRGPLSASAPPPARSSGAMGCWIGPDTSPRLAAFTVMFGPAVYQGDFFGGGPDVRGGRRPRPGRRGHDQGRDSRVAAAPPWPSLPTRVAPQWAPSPSAPAPVGSGPLGSGPVDCERRRPRKSDDAGPARRCGLPPPRVGGPVAASPARYSRVWRAGKLARAPQTVKRARIAPATEVAGQKRAAQLLPTARRAIPATASRVFGTGPVDLVRRTLSL